MKQIDAAAELKAWETGAPLLWERAERYHIIDGEYLTPEGDYWQYAPALHRELPAEIAKLREGDTALVSDFAEKYGPLGYAQTTGAHRHDMILQYDSLGWIWAHARGIRIVLETLEAMSRRDEAAARKLLRSMRADDEKGDEAKQWRIRPLIGILHQRTLLRQTYSPEEPALVAVGKVALEIIDGNLAGTRREAFLHEETLRFKSRYHVHSLIQMAYWHLMNLAEATDPEKPGQLARCEDPKCGALFIRTDKRQRFCPPRHRETESRCAARVRKQNERAKA